MDYKEIQGIKEGYYASMEKFNSRVGEYFGACLKQIFSIHENAVLEWRIRKSDNTMCLIEFWDKGNGYVIYEPETNKA